jgi:polyvinyl alcohol dehydrogenase (cytochrome)
VYNMPGVGDAGGPDADVGAHPNLFTVDGRDLVGVGDKAGVYTALDRDSGEEVWRNEMTTGSRLGGVIGGGAYEDGVVFTASNVGDPVSQVPTNLVKVFAIDAATGDTLWEADLESSAFGAASVASGVVYQGTTDGVMHALDAETGDELWTAEPGGDIGGGPSIVDGVVYWGHGYWVFAEPEGPDGGLVAFALPR